MNNQEAKLILQAYRLGGQDAADPQFQEALEQLKRDPDLAQWFAEERALETRIQTKLRAALAPPAQLKASLLAQRKILPPVVWWKQPGRLAIAATIVLLAAIAALWIKPSNGLLFAAFRQAMVQHSREMTDHGSLMAHDAAGIQHLLREQHIDANFDLPAALRGKPIQGCGVVNWQGQKVTLICFMLDGKVHADLFVIGGTHFRDFTPPEIPEFARADGLMTAGWTRGERTYLLTSAAEETVIRHYL